MESEKIKDYKFDAFYEALLEGKIVYNNLIKDLILMLEELCTKASKGGKAEPKMSDECKVFLTIYFIILNDGSICFPLDAKEVLNNKQFGTLLGFLDLNDNRERFVDLISRGIEDFRELKDIYEDIVYDSIKKPDDFNQIKPFVIYTKGKKDFLFPSKYFRAKLEVESKINELFTNSKSNSTLISDDENKNLNKDIESLRKSDDKLGYKFELNKQQAEAVLRAEAGENLFITGGAGTGKTTAVFYLLYKLLKSNINRELYLIAPSGKAQDRLKESIQDAYNEIDIDKLPQDDKEVFEKIKNTNSSTIHSLLSINPKDGGFKYNKDNQFDENSIFVVDEASMIDVSLFASLLNAIKPGSRIFILGDENQLPSVEAGAVLGTLLSQKDDSTVKLIKSNRQKDGTQLAEFAKAIIEQKEGVKLVLNDDTYNKIWLKSIDEFCAKFSILENKLQETKGKKDYDYPVFAYDITLGGSEPRANKTTAIDDKILKSYFDVFYSPLYKKGSYNLELKIENLVDKNKKDDEIKNLKKLLKLQKNSQILSANKEGFCGTKYLNGQMNIIANSKASEKSREAAEPFTQGNPVIITKNMKNINLYNGDNGIVVKISYGSGKEKSSMNYFLIEKKTDEKMNDNSGGAKDCFASIFRVGNYLFYPLSLIPADSVELAYAITIHKSQGSGYNNILMFLPEDKNSQLLNRQILYTGITRTKGNTFIVSSIDNFKIAQKNNIKRWTEIEIRGGQ